MSGQYLQYTVRYVPRQYLQHAMRYMPHVSDEVQSEYLPQNAMRHVRHVPHLRYLPSPSHLSMIFAEGLYWW
jgi:hypothetical protein